MSSHGISVYGNVFSLAFVPVKPYSISQSEKQIPMSIVGNSDVHTILRDVS